MWPGHAETKMNGFSPSLFSGQRFAVFGLGKNGLPAVLMLASTGATVQVWDDGEGGRKGLADALSTLAPDVAARITCKPFENLNGFEALILSPGIPHVLPKPHPIALMAKAAGIPILSDAEVLYRAVHQSGSKARFVGITGTNGKSTTTTLLAHILAEAKLPVAAGGNLGPAALALPLLPDNGVYVLEMSSYMLERLDTLRFDATCLLNLTPDHLDRHAGMDGYAQAKNVCSPAKQTRIWPLLAWMISGAAPLPQNWNTALPNVKPFPAPTLPVLTTAKMVPYGITAHA